MPNPTLRPSGVYQLNVRVPADLTKVVPGTTTTLPVGAGLAAVTASDKVMLSLRTKDLHGVRWLRSASKACSGCASYIA